MAIDLMALEPQKISRDLKGKMALVFGDPKCGKTTLASELDKVLIASFEPGTNALNNVLVQPILKWTDWKIVVKQLVRKKDELQNKIHIIAIDTVDEAYKLCEKYICDQNGIEKIKDIPYGGGYKLLDDEFSSTLREIAFAGYGLFFISHAKEKTIEEKGVEHTKVVPALADRPFNIVNKMVDIIAYLKQVPVEQREDGSFVRKRYLFLRETDDFYAGSRFKYIVPKVELSYENLVKAIYDAIDAEIEHTTGKNTENLETNIAPNPYYQKSFDDMMDEAKTLWGKVIQRDLQGKAAEILDKEFGKPTKFSEILPEQIDKLSKVLFEVKTLLE